VQRCVGVVALAQGRYDEAELRFRKALSIDNQDAKSITGLGAIKAHKGELEDAFNYYAKALAMMPAEGTTMLYFMGICYELGRYAELEEALLKYLEVDRTNLDMKFCLAGCLYKQERYVQASRVLVEILNDQPHHVMSSELLKLTDEKIQETVTQHQQEMEVSPQQEVSNNKLTKLEVLQKERQFDEVIALADEILSESDAALYPLARIFKADALTCKGEFAQALSLYEMEEENPAVSYRAINGKGVIAATNEMWNEAIAFFNQAIELERNNDVAYAGLGVCALMQGSDILAWDYFKQALSYNPENIRAIYGFVQLAYKLGKLPELETALVNYLEYRPANLSMLYSLAGCLYAQGKVDIAIEQLDKILIFDPENGLATELLNKIYLEHPDEAKLAHSDAALAV